MPGIKGFGHQVHHKFLVCGFNGSNPVVYCGSSNLAVGGEKSNRRRPTRSMASVTITRLFCRAQIPIALPARPRLLTLIQTARLNDVDPQAWLADVLARIADHKITDLTALLPWNWRRAVPVARAA